MQVVYILSSTDLSVKQSVVVPKKTNPSEKEKLEQLSQFLCNDIFNSDQNICVMSHFQKRSYTVSSSWPQNVHKSESTIFQMNKYLLVGSNLCTSQKWSHLSCESEVILWHFANYVFLQFSSSYSTSQLHAVQTVSSPDFME